MESGYTMSHTKLTRVTSLPPRHYAVRVAGTSVILHKVAIQKAPHLPEERAWMQIKTRPRGIYKAGKTNEAQLFNCHLRNFSDSVYSSMQIDMHSDNWIACLQQITPELLTNQ